MTVHNDTLKIKILATLIAVLIWGWIQLNEETTDVKRATIAYNKPSDLIETETLPASASVEIKGSKGRIRQMSNTPLQIIVDISDAHLGKNSRTLQSDNIQGLPEGVTVERLTPPVLDFELATPSIREIPIKPNIVGIPNSDYKISSIESTPNSVSIKGPELLLNELEYISTKPINVQNITESEKFTTQIVLNSSVLSINQANLVEVFIEVTDKYQYKVIEGVETASNRLDWEVFPKQVSVLAGSLEDNSQLEKTQLLLNVDTLITVLEDSTQVPFQDDEYTVRFEEHPELFMLMTSVQHTIRNIEPNEFKLRKIPPTEKR